MSTDRFQMPNDQTLCSIFNGADKDRSGAISGPELQKALSNGTWKPFNITLVMKMITMFDKDGNGTISYNEFCQLWKYINDWLNCYHRFDQNGDGSINRVELNQALSSFGYRLSEQFYELAMRKFGDKDAIVFDNFILLCITLQAATAAFSAVDVQRKGEAKVTYEQFLNMVVPII